MRSGRNSYRSAPWVMTISGSTASIELQVALHYLGEAVPIKQCWTSADLTVLRDIRHNFVVAREPNASGQALGVPNKFVNNPDP